MSLKYEKYPYIVLHGAGKCKNHVTSNGLYSPELCAGQYCVPFGDNSLRIDHEETLKLKSERLIIEENQKSMNLEKYVSKFHPTIVEEYTKWCKEDKTN